jgi:hypothetical protein
MSPRRKQAPFLSPEIKWEGDDGQSGATILITQATYAQVRDRVRVDPDVLPCQAQGKGEPIPVYRVLRLSGLEEEGGNGGAT